MQGARKSSPTRPVPISRFWPISGMWRWVPPTAYGWAAFELAHAVAAIPVDSGVLLHLVVPETEVLLDGGRALLRSTHSGTLSAVETVVARAEPLAGTARPTVQVDLDANADAYRDAVASVVADIRAGALQKAVLSRVVPVDGELDFPATYAAGRFTLPHKVKRAGSGVNSPGFAARKKIPSELTIWGAAINQPERRARRWKLTKVYRLFGTIH